ncbi:hypothetical protein TNIN_419321 [Trichonephila inaurata madagascariensis]|uniref:Uncharacterized protein n=1 Tax=Trichonephila inaurata madagascariensis TaxID=2747483 RepID=A0A8X6XWA1_9ARAC|nr:hypothetical protein TNIN_419321 [Trichonephila inaurata madagascariensis]
MGPLGRRGPNLAFGYGQQATIQQRQLDAADRVPGSRAPALGAAAVTRGAVPPGWEWPSSHAPIHGVRAPTGTPSVPSISRNQRHPPESPADPRSRDNPSRAIVRGVTT